MKLFKTVFSVLFLAIGMVVYGQINMTDSTVQVITYWDKKEVQNYTVSKEKIQIENGDTISRQITAYDVEVKVLKKKKNWYTIQWTYKNPSFEKHSNPSYSNIDFTQDLKIIYKTDPLGTFIEVVNWKEIQKHIFKTGKILKALYSTNQEMEGVIDRVIETYSSKEAIENFSLKDIQLFHTFHGAEYKLGEVIEANFQIPNLAGPNDFDAEFLIYLDEIHPDEGSYIIRSTQVINPDQLIDATINHMKRLSDEVDAKALREALKDMKNEILTSSLLHESGWIIWSAMTTHISTGTQSNIEERIIELK